MLKPSKVLIPVTLLTVLLLVAVIVVTLADGGLSITIDGKDDDWMPGTWVCPGGKGCNLPGTDYTAWLCCNTTSTPRACQLVWKDATEPGPPPDIYYAKVYLNSTGIYLFINVKMKHDDVISVWLNSTDYKLRINITFPGRNIVSVSYYLLMPGGSTIEGSGIGVASSNNYQPGFQTRDLEIGIPFNNIANYSPASSGTYDISVRIGNDRMEINATITKITLTVSNYHIANAYYTVNTTSIPIPIPEPGILIAVTALTSVVLLAVFIAKKSSNTEQSATPSRKIHQRLRLHIPPSLATTSTQIVVI